MPKGPLQTVEQSADEKRPVAVNLSSHHAQCELNYHMCMALLPDCRTGRNHWTFILGDGRSFMVCVSLIESAPYTSTIEVVQKPELGRFLQPLKLRLRLYHDAAMAEVVAWDRHRNWLPVYGYPNAHMYHPDEKLALNRFLGEWLSHCRKLGIVCEPFCEYSRITKK